MGFFEPSVIGGGGGGRGHEDPHHNFIVIAPMIMKFGKVVKLDLHSGNKKFVTSLLLRHYEVITYILGDT